MLALSACSLLPPAADAIDEGSGCTGSLIALQGLIDEAGAADRWHHRVHAQPSYRSTRFLASFAEPPPAPALEIAWRAALHELGLQDLRLEWQRLPSDRRAAWRATSAEADLEAFLQRCGASLWLDSLSRPLTPDAVRVPDAYSAAQRALGLYPLARLVAGPAVRAEQDRQRSAMTAALPARRASILYEPPVAADPAPPAPWPRNALGMPRLDAEALDALLARHAPRVQVLQAGAADRIGAAAWAGGRRTLDRAQPTLYTHLSHLRSAHGTLLQLNYTLWFPERPPASAHDPYAGRFDGLVWRVTLAADGGVLFQDSIHPCGCYHAILLPADGTLPLAPQDGADEPLLVQRHPVPRAGPAPVLLLSAGDHQLLRVMAAPLDGAERRRYGLAPHDALRAMDDGAGRVRSWYDDDGLVGDSRRGERFFLWPLGVPSAGAMRQPGRHAIQFLGTRHFDDAWLEDWLRRP